MLDHNLDLATAFELTAQQGYAFVDGGLIAAAREALLIESEHLDLESIGEKEQLIRPDEPSEVRQSHARACGQLGDSQFEAASHLAEMLAAAIRSIVQLPELARWSGNNLCYQLYRPGAGRISPHRDNKSDQLLGVTVTITGRAVVRIFEPHGEPDDYTNLQQIDEHAVSPGDIMLLRSTGFAAGERVIHEVLPPESDSRLVLNLRMK